MSALLAGQNKKCVIDCNIHHALLYSFIVPHLFNRRLPSPLLVGRSLLSTPQFLFSATALVYLGRSCRASIPLSSEGLTHPSLQDKYHFRLHPQHSEYLSDDLFLESGPLLAPEMVIHNSLQKRNLTSRSDFNFFS